MVGTSRPCYQASELLLHFLASCTDAPLVHSLSGSLVASIARVVLVAANGRNARRAWPQDDAHVSFVSTRSGTRLPTPSYVTRLADPKPAAIGITGIHTLPFIVGNTRWSHSYALCAASQRRRINQSRPAAVRRVTDACLYKSPGYLSGSTIAAIARNLPSTLICKRITFARWLLHPLSYLVPNVRCASFPQYQIRLCAANRLNLLLAMCFGTVTLAVAASYPRRLRGAMARSGRRTRRGSRGYAMGRCGGRAILLF